MYEKVIDVCGDKYFYQSLLRYKDLAFIIKIEIPQSHTCNCVEENIMIKNKCTGILASLIIHSQKSS